MGGPMRPMQQANMAPPHQPHMHRNPHLSHGQMLSMPPRAPQHMHHIQHPTMSHNNSRHMIIDMNPSSNAFRRIILCTVVLLSLLSGTDAKKFIDFEFDLEYSLMEIFGPTGCIEGNILTVGMKDQTQVSVLQNQNVQNLHQQSQGSNMEQKKSVGDELGDGSISNQQNANGTNSNLANMKEKTPMCLVNELARFNKIQHQYRLTNEQGPAHKKRFTVTLKLGKEEYVAEGPSIKKAQHTAASEALSKTWYSQPPLKPLRTMRAAGKCPAGSGHLPPTVELNALAMKRGEPTVYTFRHAPPAAPQQFVSPGFVHYPRMYNPRYPAYNRNFHNEQQGYYLVSLKVGEREFVGRGVTGQAARHDAASRALEQLRQLPLPEMFNDNYNANENGTTCSIDDPNAELKSPVSLVHETALKRGLPVTFEVISETGKPHIRTFTTKCIVGDEVTIGEGSSKKVSKKRAAELMMEKLKRLPPISVSVQNGTMRLKRKPPAIKKKARNLIKEYKEPRAESESAEEVNPISRLVQIQQANREKEPDYNLIEEKGAPRRREFVMEVTVGQYSTQGIGPTKKLAKRAAAEALLALLGYSKPQPQPAKPSIKSGDKENNDNKPRKVTFLEDEQLDGANHLSSNSSSSAGGGTIGRQLVPGLLLVDGGQECKSGPSLQLVAEELRGQQKKQKPPAGVSPKDQLKYLAQLLNFDVQFSDFPKGLYKEYLSLVSLSTDPPQVCHGHGPTTDASRDHAALTALRTLSKLGLDSVTNSQSPKDKPPQIPSDLHVANQVKNNMINGAIDK